MKSQAFLLRAREWIEDARILEGNLESECMRITAGDVRKETKTNKPKGKIIGTGCGSLARTTC